MDMSSFGDNVVPEQSASLVIPNDGLAVLGP